MMKAGMLLIICAVNGQHFIDEDDEFIHPIHEAPLQFRSSTSDELDSSFWQMKAQALLNAKMKQTPNTKLAKNVILFVGDGMSVTTLTAARMYKAELHKKRIGEGEPLSFETFPYVGLSQTYCVDFTVADSACSATAYLTGVKTNEGTIGVNANVLRRDCASMQNTEFHVDSIAQWFQNEGLATGFVTNTRVTHATPAGTYAHTANRQWENDVKVAHDGADPEKCRDIAYQLVHGSPGKNFNVIMGGGRSQFTPHKEGGNRADNRNLIEAWKSDKKAKNETYAYIETRDELLSLTTNPTHLMGLFATNHLDDHLANNTNQPTLAEMTEKAINVLKNNGKGFFLFVEGGKIDLAHHGNQARVSLDETNEFSKAVAVARAMTSCDDTLIVATADHAHTMSFSGYSPREESIFDFAGTGEDGKPYMALSYANGPGFQVEEGGRHDLNKDDTDFYGYVYPAGVPLKSESHGGDDVAVFADGPWAHLFTGSYEENYIPHALAFAACVGKGATACGLK